ncbi:MAG: hypothetical protein KH004_03155 [Actinomyces sp. oral taxon 181]|uniref:hypothetical protein n=1 Tax=Actinomyces sp. oral taxon 181 TaxID=712121 RepID=UPI0025BC2C4A|nr:hypothetical protein [Actinomyces sp. oral taxon 181]MBS4796288.1 hypothetical protein [Actinomyces sp. oral taxon 181]
MPSSFPRPTARSFLACALACGFLAAIGLPAPTHAAEQEVSISESVYARNNGRSQYELSIFDRTQTMSEATCEAVPLAQQWSVVEFEANSSYNYCRIETDFNRYKNPYVAVDSSGHLTFAAKPVKIEDLNLGLPSDTTVSSHRFSLMGRNLNTSRVSEGASVRRDDSGDTVHWDEVSEKVVAAEGTVEIDDRFHAQEREDINGISAVEVPTDLQAPNVTTPSSDTGTGGLGRMFFGTPGMSLVLFSSLFIIVVLVLISAVLISRRRKKKAGLYQGGFTSYQAGVPFPQPYGSSTPAGTYTPTSMGPQVGSAPTSPYQGSLSAGTQPPSPSSTGWHNPFEPPKN